MAGIIDVRYDKESGRWSAQPRFAYDRNTYENGSPIAYGKTPYDAIGNLSFLLPLEMGNQLRIANSFQRLYNSPERIGMYDKCIELDGRRPSKDEFRERRAKFLMEQDIKKALGHV